MQKKNKTIFGNKGALLLEVLLAVIILATCLTVIINSLVSSLRGIVYSKDYSTAVFLLESKMFEVIQHQFVETGLDEENEFPEPFDKYKYKMKIEQVDSADDSGMLSEVNLEVAWVSGLKEKKIVASTYILNKQEEQ